MVVVVTALVSGITLAARMMMLGFLMRADVVADLV